MEDRFYLETLQTLVADQWLDVDAEVLAVAATAVDRDVMLATGLRCVTISNLDERLRGEHPRLDAGWTEQWCDTELARSSASQTGAWRA